MPSARKALYVKLARTLVSLVILTVAGPALAAPSAPRHVQASYVAPTSVRGVTTNDAEIQYSDYGSVTVSPDRGDRNLLVKATDKSGQHVPMLVMQDLNGDGTGDLDYGEFCDRSTRLRLKTAAPVIVYLQVGQCSAGPATATTGVVDFTFTR
jgi:hypothetical protein